MNQRFRNVILKVLQRDNPLKYLGVIMGTTGDTDFAVRRVLNVLAATQEIPLARKDNLRKAIRVWYRAQFGDRKFFADSDLHRKHKRVMV